MYNIEKEIQEILDPLIFNASHELKGHCLFEHVISDRDLLLKLKWMRKAQGNEIVLASRFFSAEQARKAIYMLLNKNKMAIEQWRKTLDVPYLEIQGNFREAVGEGIAKNTDFSNKIPLHRLRVVLVKGDSIGRASYIKTAYPTNSITDNDVIYEAMDDWKKKETKLKRSRKS